MIFIRIFLRLIFAVSWRLLFKATFLWGAKGFFAIRAFKKRLKRNELFPPFLFFSLTNACQLRCRGCWVSQQTEPDYLPIETIEKAIQDGQKQSVYFYTLLGGEPFLAPTFWDIIEKHSEAYFQVITNGHFFDAETVARLKKCGNVTPLVSIDGFRDDNDARRGAGTYDTAIDGCRELQKRKMFYGIATTVTAQNFDGVLTEEYVRHFIGLGASYLWFYAYRPVGADPTPELALDETKMLEFRKRLLDLRRAMPIILIDTYWDAQGRAVCPASKGMAFQIGPKGSVEPCPPLTVAMDYISGDTDLFRTINESDFLARFMKFVKRKFNDDSQGCVILEHPKELAAFFRKEKADDLSNRDFLNELETATPKVSHFLPGKEQPETLWGYAVLKKMLFFGMSGYG